MPLSFQPHPVAKQSCTPRQLGVPSGLGDGMMRYMPTQGRSHTNYSTELLSGTHPAAKREPRQEGEPMAFIVIASAEQGLDDLVRLIQVLGCAFRDSAHEPGTVLARHSYVIHLDQSAPESLHEQVRGLQQQVHEEQWLHVLEPIDVSWGGPSMLQVLSLSSVLLSLSSVLLSLPSVSHTLTQPVCTCLYWWVWCHSASCRCAPPCTARPWVVCCTKRPDRERRGRLAWKGKSSCVPGRRFMTPCRRFALWIGQTCFAQIWKGSKYYIE